MAHKNAFAAFALPAPDEAGRPVPKKLLPIDASRAAD
jgi:hypothetical protein